MRREHIVDGWWEMPGKPVPELQWPGTKNGQSHRVWLPKAVRAIIGDGVTGFVFTDSAASPSSALMLPCATSAPSSASRAGDAARSAPHPWQHHHCAGFRPRRHEPNPEPQARAASPIVYDRHGYAEENKRIMEAVASKIMALVEGTPTGKVVPIRR